MCYNRLSVIGHLSVGKQFNQHPTCVYRVLLHAIRVRVCPNCPLIRQGVAHTEMTGNRYVDCCIKDFTLKSVCVFVFDIKTGGGSQGYLVWPIMSHFCA
jgi:hypothetical protein